MRKPTEKELQDIARPVVTACGFGVAETIALGALLFTIWSHYNPRADRSVAVCKKLYKGNPCGMQFISTEKEDGFIISYCSRKHMTKMRIK